MTITNFFTEPGVFSQLQPSTALPTIPGGLRVVALIGTGRTTNLVKGEAVTKGSVDAQDTLAHSATSLGTTLVDQDLNTYTLGVDYQLTSGKVDWALSSAAFIVGTANEPYTGLVGKTLILTVSGGSPVTYTFLSGDFAVPASPTAAEVAIAINAAFPGVTATAVTGPKVKIATTATNNASLLIGNGTGNTLLGFTGGSFVQTPREPAATKVYYIDYEYAKAAGDYTPKFYFSMDTVKQDYGDVSTSHTLSVGAELVFEQGASVVCLVQVNPTDGAPLTQFQNGLNKLSAVNGINIVVPLTTDTNLFASVKTHVTNASSITERKERTAILGLSGSPSVQTVVAQATALADKRLVLVYPTSGTRYLGNSTTISTLDGSFLAAALAGIRTSTSFTVSDPLTRKEVTGFVDIPDTLLRSEKNVLSGNGVCVIESQSSIPRVRYGTTTDTSTSDNKEYSVVEITDYVASSMRQLLESIFIGQKILADTPSQVRSTITAVLTDFIRRETITGFTGVSASIDLLDPTQINVSFSIAPVRPLNYILITFSLTA